MIPRNTLTKRILSILLVVSLLSGSLSPYMEAYAAGTPETSLLSAAEATEEAPGESSGEPAKASTSASTVDETADAATDGNSASAGEAGKGSAVNETAEPATDGTGASDEEKAEGSAVDETAAPAGDESEAGGEAAKGAVGKTIEKAQDNLTKAPAKAAAKPSVPQMPALFSVTPRAGYFEYKISGGNSVKAGDLVQYLIDNDNLDPNFAPLVTTPGSGSATVSGYLEDAVVTVDAGSVGNVITITNANAWDDSITVIVSTDMVAVTSTYDSGATLAVQWNDNGGADPTCKGPRPAANDPDLSSWLELKFSVDGGTTLWDASDLMRITGIDPATLTMDPAAIDLLNSAYLDTTTDENFWTMDLSAAKLPRTYRRGGEITTITWYAVENSAPENYIEDKKMSRLGAAERDPDYALKNTAELDFSVNMALEDANDQFGTRNNQVGVTFELKEMGIGGGTTSTIDTVTANADQGTLSYDGLRAFDASGNPVTYYLELDPASSSILDSRTDNKGSSCTYSEKYFNVGDYSSYQKFLCNGGTIKFYLDGTTDFSYSKTWTDDGSQTRPQAKLNLYVISENYILENGTFDPNRASAVTGTLVSDVPQTDTANISVVTGLPLYNENGERLVYFAYETRLGSYMSVVDNSNAKEPAAIKNEFDLIKASGAQTPKYILNEGAVENRITDTTVVSTDVTLKLGSLQNTGTNEVKLLLERYDPDANDWVSVTYGDYIGYDGTENPASSVTTTLTGFTEETYVMSAESERLPKYDSSGKPLTYRYRQTDITINGRSISVPGWNYDVPGYNGTYSAAPVGASAPGAGGQNVDLFISGTTAVDPAKQYTSIVNQINAPMYIGIKKTWWNNGENETALIGANGGYIECKLSRNGAVLKDGTGNDLVVRLDQDNYDTKTNSWTYVLKDINGNPLPRFDDNGKEYAYDLMEVTASPSNYYKTSSFSEQNTPDSTGNYTVKELDIDLTNTAATGSGPGIELAAQKKWLDGGDITSRKPVFMGLFSVEYGGLIRTVQLDSSNNWFAEASVGVGTIVHMPDGSTYSLTEQDIKYKQDKFVFIEIGVGDLNNTALLHYYIDNNNNSKSYTQWTKSDIEALANIANGADFAAAGSIADDSYDPGDPQTHTGQSPYTYDCLGKKSTTALGRVLHIWENRRRATTGYTLTKTWKDGGKMRESRFVLERNGISYATFTTDDTTPQTMPDNASIQVGPTTDGKGKEVRITGLPKYDENGDIYQYAIREIEIYDETQNAWVALSQGRGTIAGVDYAATCNVDIAQGQGGTDYGTPHRNGDMTYWKAENSLEGSGKMTFNKVWYDEGKLTERPLCSFSVYRISLAAVSKKTGKTLEQALTDYYAQTSTTQKLPLETDFTSQSELIYTVNSDRFYDAKTFYWDIDIGEQPYYDDEGYGYVYYAQENMNGTTNYSSYFINVPATTIYPKPTKPDPNYPTDPKKVVDETDPKTIYDIHTGNDIYFDTYKDDTYMLLSDGGIHKDGNNSPFGYWTRTFVNAREEKRVISGRKVWQLPDGWTVKTQDMPTVKFELYRSTTDITLVNNEYKNVDFNRWVSSTGAERVCYIVLHETDASKVGQCIKEPGDTVPTWYFGAYSYSIPDCDKYDLYGMPYYYYAVEQPATGQNCQIQAYPSDAIIYNVNTFTVDNVYEYNVPWARVEVEKTWKVGDTVFNDLGITTSTDKETFVKGLVPVTVSLYAAPRNQNDNNPAEMAVKDLIPIADEYITPNDTNIILSTYTDPNTNENYTTATLKVTFSTYEFSTLKKRIPYYGPNGKPFVFYVSETLVNGYEQTLKLTDNGVTTGTNAMQRDYAYRIPDLTVKGTDTDGDELYSNMSSSVLFDNNYTAGVTKFNPIKIWNDGNVNNDIYRPDSLEFLIKRESKDTPNNVLDTTWSYKATLKKQENTGNATWYATTADKTALSALQEYDPLGRAYRYYIYSETAYNGTTPLKTAVNKADSINDFYNLETKVDNALTNRLSAEVTVKLEKSWLYRKNSADTNGTKLSWTEFVKMRAMGALPDQVQFVVQRRKGTGVWEYVTATGTGSRNITLKDEQGNSHSNVLGYTVDIQNLNAGTFSSDFHLNTQWEHLPKWDENGSGSGNTAYEYRVIEFLTWTRYNDATQKNETKIIRGPVTTAYNTDAKLNAYGVESTAKDTSTDSDSTYKTTMSNFVQNQVVCLEKDWIDDRNQDNTRPATIDLTITSPEGGVLTFTLTTQGGTSEYDKNTKLWHSRYRSELIYLPGDASLTKYEVNEQTAATFDLSKDYTLPTLPVVTNPPLGKDKDGNDVYVYTIENVRKTSRPSIAVKADKTWVSDGAWKDITRPDIQYKLQYKTQNTYDEVNKKVKAGTWTDFGTNPTNGIDSFRADTTKSAQDVVIDKKAATTTDYTHTWDNLKKYWDNPLVDGVPELIEYRVQEIIVPDDTLSNWYTNQRKSPTSTSGSWTSSKYLEWNFVKDTSTINDTYEGTYRNTLITKTLNLKKTWTGIKDNAATGATISAADVRTLVNLKVLPEELRFVVEYKLSGTTTWTPVPVAAAPPKNVTGVTAVASQNGYVDITTEALLNNANGIATGFALPRFDNTGTAISYRVRETDLRFKGDTTFTSINWDNPETTGTLGSITTKPVSITLGSASSVTTTVNNDYAYTSVTVDKTWIDENNRDGKRGDIKVELWRDNKLYGEEVSTNGGVNTAGTRPFGATFTINKSRDASGKWTLTWNYLPKYKDDRSGDSVYQWKETTPPAGYTNNHGTSLIPAASTASAKTEETNVYQPLRSKLTVTKLWFPEDTATNEDPFRARSEVYLQLQYKNALDQWTPVSYYDLEKVTGAVGKEYYAKVDPKTLEYKWRSVADAYTSTPCGKDAVKLNDETNYWVKLTKDTTWTYTWENLPVYQRIPQKGKEATVATDGRTRNITYRVVEGIPVKDPKTGNIIGMTPIAQNGKLNGYSVEYSTTGVSFTEPVKPLETKVKNTLDTTSLTVEKIWENEGTFKTSVRPTAISFKIEYRKKGEDDTKWAPLPKGLKTLTNVTFDAANNSYVVLTTADQTSAADTTWRKVVNGLPVMDAVGTSYEYQVTEAKLTYPATIGEVSVRTEGTKKLIGPYEITTDVAQKTGLTLGKTTTVTSRNKLITGKVSVKKVWLDEKDRDGGRKDIEVQLKRDGVNNGNPVTLTLNTASPRESGTHTWTELLIYKNDGTKYTYAVEEVGESGGKYTGANNVEYTVSYSGTINLDPDNAATAKEATITNTHVPDRGMVTVHKNWVDNGDPMDARPADITVRLQYKVGTNGAWTDIVRKALDPVTNLYPDDGIYTTDNPTLQLTKAGNWSDVTWHNLPLKTNGKTSTVETVYYKVIEDKVPGYTTTYTGDTNIEPTTAGKTTTITNTLQTEGLTILKSWTDVRDPLIRPVSVKFHVEYSLDNVTWKPLPTVCGVDANGDVAVDAAGSWTVTLTNLPSGTGKPYDYRVSEVSAVYDINGVSHTLNATDGKFTGTTWSGKLGAYTATINVTSQPGTGTSAGTLIWSADAANIADDGDLYVEKTWDDENDRDLMRPGSIELTLYKVKAGIEPDDIFIDKVTVTPDPVTGAWSQHWQQLPLENYDGSDAYYYVVETPITGYQVTYSGNTTAADAAITPAVSPAVAQIDVENTYKPNPVYIDPGVTKVINSLLPGVDPKTDKDFEFEITGVGTVPMPPNRTVTVHGQSTSEFGDIQYTRTNTYEYTIRELKPANAATTHPGYTFDENPIKLIVVVEVDRTTADLAAEVYLDKIDPANVVTAAAVNGQSVYAVKVTNDYRPLPVDAKITAKKTLKNMHLTDGMFEFRLMDETKNVITTVKNKGQEIVFSGLTELTLDEVKDYTFYLEEVKGSKSGMDYDKEVFKVVLTAFDNDGVLDYKVTCTNAKGRRVEEAEFINTYHATIPKTGYGEDPFRQMLLFSSAVLALLTGVWFRRRRRI